MLPIQHPQELDSHLIDSPVAGSGLPLDLQVFNKGLFDYLDKSPTTFHAVNEAIIRLEKVGFEPLLESDSWQLELGKKYYIQRNDSSLIAFHYVNNHWAEQSVRLYGAHCDSPCLKVKPNPESKTKNYLSLGVEVYGGVLLNPWFDRDLSLAGRVIVELNNNTQIALAINFKKAMAFIPSLAIHLDREANKSRSINPQKDILPIVLQYAELNKDLSFHDVLLEQLSLQYPKLCNDFSCIRDFELSFYDVQKASYVGLKDDFFASARLDNLLSCYVGIEALVQSSQSKVSSSKTLPNTLIVINDHEEVGSQTAQGAQGAFLSTVIERICGGLEESARCLSKSLLISADNAHGIHPNYPDRHDSNHGPLLNAGPVIKTNANQRYATNSVTSSCFKKIADSVGVETQSFVVRSDMACGSTIGPITSAELGVQTIDVGVPTFAMHSIRESAGSKDTWSLFKIIQGFFEEENLT